MNGGSIRDIGSLVFVGISLAAAAAISPTRARACGGCFVQTEEVTVVTAHRMAVAISPTQTTLWDQIQYAGNPSDFVWVLPVAGTTLVELADNAFFEALERRTRIELRGVFAPPPTCPDPCGSFVFGSTAGEAPRTGADAGGPPVTVYGEATIGPYQTVTIGSENPEALVDWLQDNGYAVPDAILPIIEHYVRLRMNFAVLRLAPNAGVNQMQPVRVTTPGMMPVFPLRMVGAGVADSVELELYVLAEGRWSAQNFATVEVARDQIAYDWNTGRFTYEQQFDAALARVGGRGWVAEAALPFDAWYPMVASYWSLDEGGRRRTPTDDLAVARTGLDAPFLTKLRTRLAARHLDEDLVLQAAETDDRIDTTINVVRELNRPTLPPCPTECTVPGAGPLAAGRGGPSGVAFGADGRGEGLCAAAAGPTGASLLGWAWVLTLFGLLRRRAR
ncbi:MAG: DUF2330 domain-containing protein [Myxococcota bacterium]|nr:DUF2330 domain-containing protein [Myxococcota bacterium]MDW8362472.1 DUF2330 domain-containing protein [Myxococcales bacterium]